LRVLLAAREAAARQVFKSTEKHLSKSEILSPQLGRRVAFHEANGKLGVGRHGAAHSFNQRNARSRNAGADIVNIAA
jgi:hypothetical protein